MFLLYALALSFHAGVNVTAAPTTMSLMDSYVQRRSDGEVGGLHLTAVLIAQLAHSDAARLERAVRKKGGERECVCVCERERETEKQIRGATGCLNPALTTTIARPRIQHATHQRKKNTDCACAHFVPLSLLLNRAPLDVMLFVQRSPTQNLFPRAQLL
jgi:hypothetical protein